MNKRPSRLVWLVLVAGVVYTLALQLVVPAQEVFFSGDGGEKALQMRQYAAGLFHVDLRLARDSWTQRLWEQGLLPIDRTFFLIDGKVYSIFPYTFPFVTAPFYAVFGMRGLYFIPLVSVWCLWLVMARALPRIEPDPRYQAALLAALIFACPITLYAVTYWEHPVATALCFAGFQFALRAPEQPDSAWRGLLYGTVLGAAGWFREECIVFAAVVLAVGFFHTRRIAGNRAWVAYSVGTAATILGYVALNMWIYGSPLGTHSMQKKNDVAFAERIHNAQHWSFEMYASYLYFMPIVLFGAGLLVALLRFAPKRIDRESWSLMAVGCATFVATGLIVPSHGDYQIGPRFLFPVIPVCWLLVAKCWREVVALRIPLLRIGFACVFLATLGLGVKRDAIDGAAILEENYRARVAPALELLLERPETVVAVADQAITQEMGVAMKSKSFFLISNSDQMRLLMEALRERGNTDFLFIALGDERIEYDSAIRAASGLPLSIHPMGRSGLHYYFYAVRLTN